MQIAFDVAIDEKMQNKALTYYELTSVDVFKGD